VATGVNKTFAWVRVSLVSQDLVPGALQERSTTTGKLESSAQTPISQGKVCFPGSKDFEEISGLSVSFLVFSRVNVRNLPVMTVEMSALLRQQHGAVRR